MWWAGVFRTNGAERGVELSACDPVLRAGRRTFVADERCIGLRRSQAQGFSSDAALPNAQYRIAIASEPVPSLAPASLLIERGAVDDFRYADQEAELARLRMSEVTARQAAEAALAAAEAERNTAREAVEAARRNVEQAEADARAATMTLTHTVPPWSRQTPNWSG